MSAWKGRPPAVSASYSEFEQLCCSQDLVVPRFRVFRENGKDGGVGGRGALLKCVLDKSGHTPRAFCDSID